MLPYLHLDFETRSVLDLREVGLHRYARHPSTDVWCASMAVNDAEPTCHPIVGHDLFPWDLLDMVGKGQMLVTAHNAPFELEIWNEIMAKRYRWPRLLVEQTFCTMAQSYAMSLPGALEDSALALGLPLHKDTEGRTLMLRMSRPRAFVGNKPVWWDDADKLTRLYGYCNQDVRVERELHKRLMPLSDHERKIWLMDYRINQRGVQADIATAAAGVVLADKIKVDADAEIKLLTGGQVESCNALIPLKKWLEDNGCPAIETGLDKQMVIDLLAMDRWHPRVRRALTLRQESSKASTSKLDKIILQAGEDGRLRNLFQYHGAGPGRWTGRGVQPHNFVRDVPQPEVVEAVFAHIRNDKPEVIDMIYGSPLEMMSRCMRGFLTAAPGKVLVGADFNNIEGRGQAWIAGEEWKLNAFRAADNGTGPGIYELTASKITGISLNEITKEIRQAYGKVPELALGFGGSIGALTKMQKTYGVKMSNEKKIEIVEGWRNAHPRIAGVLKLSKNGRWYRDGGVWKALNAAAIDAVKTPGITVEAATMQPVKYKTVGSFLWCLLPSGRAICYPYPKILAGEYSDQLTYMTMPGVEDERIDDPQNSPRWARITTHGGPLLQNVVSGICRDLLADAMLDLEDTMAYNVVLHVHDDANIEVLEKDAEAAKFTMNEVMNHVPAWATGFPITAKAKIMRRYGG